MTPKEWEIERMRLWVATYAAFYSTEECRNAEEAANAGDLALGEFDKLFSEPPEPKAGKMTPIVKDWVCTECGHRLTEKQAEKAFSDVQGCPKCGGGDIEHEPTGKGGAA